MSVFKVDKDFAVVVNRDAVKLVPELKSLTDVELRYVILVADYVDGPLRKKPLEERRLMARKIVYKDTNKDPETAKMKLALEAYKGLVFDIRRETIDIYKQKVRALQKESLAPDASFARMKELDSTINFLQARISSMEHELDIEESEEINLKGKKKLSFVEIWQRRQKEHHKFKNE